MMLVVVMLTMASQTTWADNMAGKRKTMWDGNTYYVTEDETINECMNITDDVTFIIADGVTLTASKGITVADGFTLTIGGTGTLIATGQLCGNLAESCCGDCRRCDEGAG